MKLSVRKKSEIVSWVDIYDGFRVKTRWVNKRQEESIRDAALPETEKWRGIYATEDPDLLAQAEAPAYVEGWENCTPDVLEAIGIELETPPSVNGNGTIAYDAEMSIDIWREASNVLYSRKIKQHNQALQLEQYEQKKRQRSSADA